MCEREHGSDRRGAVVLVQLVHLRTSAATIAFLASARTSLIAASPRFQLAKDGVFTGVWAVWFIASARTERPAAFIFARPFMEGMQWFASRSWGALWETEPQFRKIWRTSSLIWGSGLLIDAAVRVVISYTLPVDAVPGLGGALFPLTFVVLQLLTNVYYNVAGLYPILGARWTAPHIRLERKDLKAHLTRSTTTLVPVMRS